MLVKIEHNIKDRQYLALNITPWDGSWLVIKMVSHLELRISDLFKAFVYIFSQNLKAMFFGVQS